MKQSLVDKWQSVVPRLHSLYPKSFSDGWVIKTERNTPYFETCPICNGGITYFPVAVNVTQYFEEVGWASGRIERVLRNERVTTELDMSCNCSGSNILQIEAMDMDYALEHWNQVLPFPKPTIPEKVVSTMNVSPLLDWLGGKDV